jgi:hypothetical protein
MYPSWHALLITFGILSLLAVPAVLALRSNRTEAKKLLESGLLAEAEILGYEVNDGIWVTYRFTPQGRTSPLECTRILLSGGERLPIGSRVPVRYKASFPSISVLVPYAGSQLTS